MSDQIQASPIEWDVFREGTPSEVSSPIATGASKPKAASSSGSRRTMSSSSIAAPVAIFDTQSDDPQVQYLSTDINKLGLFLYDQQVSGSKPWARFTIGSVVVVAYFLGDKALVAASKAWLGRKGATAAKMRAGAELAETAAEKATQLLSTKKGRGIWAKMHEASDWIAKKVTQLADPSPANKGIFRKIMGRGAKAVTWGISAGAGIAFISEIGNWFGDLFVDWAMKWQFFFTADFSRDHFSRLVRILEAGQKRRIPGSDAGMYVDEQFSASEFMALAILASERVVGGPSFDPRTTASIANIAATAIKKAATENRPLQEVLGVMTVKLPVASPDAAVISQDDARLIVSQTHAILARFMRQVQDIDDFDAEDIIVPITLMFDRISVIPGVLSKTVGSIALGSDVLIAQTFSEETDDIIDAITEGQLQSGQSFWDKLCEFVSASIDAAIGRGDNTADATQFLIPGGLNVQE